MKEIEKMERVARIKAREDLRNESGYYLYAPSKNNLLESSKRKEFFLSKPDEKDLVPLTDEKFEEDMKKLIKYNELKKH